MDFLALLQQIGFEDAELGAETGFNSSPKTKGVLVRAKKADSSIKTQKPAGDSESGDEKVHAMERGMPPSIKAILEKAYRLGCEKAKIIDASTVIVEKWVRWKCLYGCPLYNKDAFHPPFAPGVDETKEVMGEYSKAILLNGPKGKVLTDIALQLEEEAYQMGFYKAFALTAIPSGTGEQPNSGAT